MRDMMWPRDKSVLRANMCQTQGRKCSVVRCGCVGELAPSLPFIFPRLNSQSLHTLRLLQQALYREILILYAALLLP